MYPHGPWGPPSHIKRGGIVYDFMVPGDPLTPGWPSVPGARRISRSEAASLPAIISAPLSYKDARVILDAKDPVVRLKVKSDDRIREIWTVTGMIVGSERPDEVVIVGNHRDAWIYGGVDPSSGSAALVELARTLSELARSGWRPKRSILFASWDAEEFTLTSSTEWGEQHQARITEGAVAYLNVDSAASGPAFNATAVPALNRLILEAAQAVRDPASGIPVAAAFRDRRAIGGSLPTGSAHELVDNRLGSGSDYTVFLNHLGIPVADLTFDGPYGVYHSIYDTHAWVARIGDPGFRYHATLVQLWGLLVLRLANAAALPLDYVHTPTALPRSSKTSNGAPPPRRGPARRSRIYTPRRPTSRMPRSVTTRSARTHSPARMRTSSSGSTAGSCASSGRSSIRPASPDARGIAISSMPRNIPTPRKSFPAWRRPWTQARKGWPPPRPLA